MMIELAGELAIFYLPHVESKSAAISRLFKVWVNLVVDYGPHIYLTLKLTPIISARRIGKVNYF